MEKKKIKKLSLRKEGISVLNDIEKSNIKGGITTSFGYGQGECTGFLCCDTNNSLPKSCVPGNCTPPPTQETCNTCQTCNDSCLSCSCITCETCVC